MEVTGFNAGSGGSVNEQILVLQRSERFSTLEDSRSACKGHLTKIYQELEPLLLKGARSRYFR